MTQQSARADLYHGLFTLERVTGGQPQLQRRPDAPARIPDPHSGRLLTVATLEAQTRAICPSCEQPGQGGYVSFVQDLRLAYACPGCLQLVWLPGS